MKTLFLSIILLIAINCAKAQTVNYNGKWQLDTAKSEFNGTPVAAQSVISEITQTDANIIIKYINQKPDVPLRSFIQKVGWDGKDYTAITYNQTKKVCSIHKNQDGSFVLTGHIFDLNGQPFSDITENWQLSSDGKILTIDRSIEQLQDGLKYTVKMIYKKQ